MGVASPPPRGGGVANDGNDGNGDADFLVRCDTRVPGMGLWLLLLFCSP